MGAYELLECGLPAHALSDHVELAKRGINPGAAKFANGRLPRSAPCCGPAHCLLVALICLPKQQNPVGCTAAA